MKIIRAFTILAASTVLLAGACTRVADLAEEGGSPAPTSPTATGPQVDATVYFLYEFENRTVLVPETHRVTSDPTGRAQLEAMLRDAPQDPDLFSPWPQGTRILGITIEHGTATVDFGAEVLAANAGATTESLGIQQAVYTLTEVPGIRRVEFRVEGRASGDVGGRRIEDWWGHEGLGAQPFARADHVLAPITIVEPVEGGRVAGTVTVSGEATVFEANVLVRLRDPDGAVALTSNATATEGAPGRGTWSLELQIPATADGTWTIEAVEESAQDGSDAFVVTRSVVVASSY